MTILSVTGHRSQKLGGYSSAVASRLNRFAIEQIAIEITLNSVNKVVVGMAIGWDQAVARACVKLGVDFIAAVPFRGQENTWPEYAQREYTRLMERAHEVVYVSTGGYCPDKMTKRNRWMVDHSDRLLALWDGSASGTGSCVEYAKSRNVSWRNCWEEWKEWK